MVDFTKYPFGIPKKAENAEKVNKILAKSFWLQQEIDAVGKPSLINIMLERILQAAGIDAKLKHGYHDGPTGVLPWAWLSISGHIVDNTFMPLPIPWQIKVKSESDYKEFIDETTELMPNWSNTPKDIYEWSSSLSKKRHYWILENKDKSFALMENNYDLKCYYYVMSAFLESEYSVETPDFFSLWDKCWTCGKESDRLKSCAKCKIACYCSRKCQKEDWRFIHKEVCVSCISD